MSTILKTINWGIIGLGNIAHKFAEDLRSIPDTALYAVASRSQKKADTFAKKYKAKKAYGSYNDLVKDPNIDAIYIATPHTFHRAHTLLCLKYHIPVLCEKPFAMNVQEVKQMIAMAKEKKRITHGSTLDILPPPLSICITTTQQ